METNIYYLLLYNSMKPHHHIKMILIIIFKISVLLTSQTLIDNFKINYQKGKQKVSNAHFSNSRKIVHLL